MPLFEGADGLAAIFTNQTVIARNEAISALANQLEDFFSTPKAKW
jgi:hypothetical protein